MRNPFKREKKALTADPGVLEAASARQIQPFISLGGTNLNSGRLQSVFVQGQAASYGYLYDYQPAVRSVIDYIARNIAQLELAVYRKTDGQHEREDAHPAAVTLANPNTWTPRQKFVFTLVADWLVYDNAYVVKFRADTVVEELVLVNVPPSAVGIIGRARFAADGYRIYRQDGTFFDVASEDVIHWRGYNPEDPRAGFSKLETLRQELAADATAREAKTELDKSGLIPKGWIERPLDAGDWSDQGIDRFREHWSNWAKQSNRKVPVLEDGMTFRQSTVSPEDAQLLESRHFTRSEVASIFGMLNVPPQTPDERRQVYADVFAPICEDICGFLDLSLLKSEYQDDDLYTAFNLDEKLRGEPLERWAALTSTTGTPWRTVNEARALEDLPPVPGGDELVTPSNTVKGGGELPAPNVMPPQHPLKPAQDGSYRTDQGPTPLPSGNGGRAALNASQDGLGERKQLHVSTEPGLFGDIARQRRNVDKASGLFVRHFNRQTKAFARKGEKAMNWDRWGRELAQELKTLIRSIFEIEGGIYISRLGGVDFDISQREHYIDAMSERIADAVGDATRQNIDRLGYEEALNQAIDEAAPLLGKSVGVRSTREARYEAAAQAPHP